MPRVLLDPATGNSYRPVVVKVVQLGRFSVYVYPEVGQPHHRPHCHVLWSDGSSVITLPTLLLLAGDDLPAAARNLIQDHSADLIAAWNLLNPDRPIR